MEKPFRPACVKRFNERCAVQPAKFEDLHRTLYVAPDRLREILCHREQRYVDAQLTLSYDRGQIISERSEITEELAGKYIELYDFADRPMEVRWNGRLLPYRTVHKDPRVTHAAVVGNKCLGHALAIDERWMTRYLPCTGPMLRSGLVRSKVLEEFTAVGGV